MIIPMVFIFSLIMNADISYRVWGCFFFFQVAVTHKWSSLLWLPERCNKYFIQMIHWFQEVNIPVLLYATKRIYDAMILWWFHNSMIQPIILCRGFFFSNHWRYNVPQYIHYSDLHLFSQLLESICIKVFINICCCNWGSKKELLLQLH